MLNSLDIWRYLGCWVNKEIVSSLCFYISKEQGAWALRRPLNTSGEGRAAHPCIAATLILWFTRAWKALQYWEESDNVAKASNPLGSKMLAVNWIPIWTPGIPSVNAQGYIWTNANCLIHCGAKNSETRNVKTTAVLGESSLQEKPYLIQNKWSHKVYAILDKAPLMMLFQVTEEELDAIILQSKE